MRSSDPAPRLTMAVLATALAQPVLAQGRPAIPEPEVVGPGAISTADLNETFPAIDPMDGALWFSRYRDSFDRQTIYVARARGDGWAEPVVAPFSGTHGDRAPRFSPDGSRLYFTSNRPVPGAASGNDLNIWVVTRGGDGGWSPPELVPAPVSLPGGRDMHAAVTADGTVFLASYREAGRGRADIYRVPWRNGAFGEPENLGATVNDSLGQTDLFVTPDGTLMILVVTDRPGGLGGDDLYVLRREGRGWSEPVHLPAPLNSHEYEYGPWLSPDGRYLYFTSHRGGTGDILRVPAATVRVR